MTKFVHDSELPAELCGDMACPEHHANCYWDTGSGCDHEGVNIIGGRRWCDEHTDELERQIAALRDWALDDDDARAIGNFV